MVTYFKDGVTEILGDGVDILFSNEVEATTYTGKANIEEAVKELKKLAGTLVLTLGDKGAMVITDNETVSIAPVKTKAVDTNGAGDMFAGSFLYGVTHGFSLQKAGDLASEAASIIVSRFGTRLEDEEQAHLKAKYC
jgi:sugar/nucleoside kinase (ribokinase family)